MLVLEFRQETGIGNERAQQFRDTAGVHPRVVDGVRQLGEASAKGDPTRLPRFSLGSGVDGGGGIDQDGELREAVVRLDAEFSFSRSLGQPQSVVQVPVGLRQSWICNLRESPPRESGSGTARRSMVVALRR